MALSIEMPSTCVGRLARIKVQGMELVGNAIDFVVDEPQHPKRIRIQYGCPALKGHTVMPHEYAFLGWADEEQD